MSSQLEFYPLSMHNADHGGTHLQSPCLKAQDQPSLHSEVHGSQERDPVSKHTKRK